MVVVGSSVFCIDPTCYRLSVADSDRSLLGFSNCKASGDRCFLLCAVCTTPDFVIAMDPLVQQKYCGLEGITDDLAVKLSVEALLNASMLQGV